MKKIEILLMLIAVVFVIPISLLLTFRAFLCKNQYMVTRNGLMVEGKWSQERSYEAMLYGI